MKIPVTCKSQIVDGLIQSIIKLEKDEEYRFKLSEGAIVRANDFSWEEKSKILDVIYKQVCRS